VDAGGGWLIFKVPPAELAAHPSDGPAGQELSFMCDDVEATVRDLRAKGVELTQEITDERWGRPTPVLLPGGGEVGLYAPPSARDRPVRGRGQRRLTNSAATSIGWNPMRSLIETM
jgi:hypothetical protein